MTNDDVTNVLIYLISFVYTLVLFRALFHCPFHFDTCSSSVCVDVLNDSFRIRNVVWVRVIDIRDHVVVLHYDYALCMYDLLDDYVAIVVNVVWHVIVFVYPINHFVIRQNYFLMMILFGH